MSNENQKKPSMINVRGSKVALGPLVREHLETLANFRQDVEVISYSDGEFLPTNVDDQISWYDKRDTTGKVVSFAIYEVENLELIGEVGLRKINHLHGIATLGISIGRKEFWGKGYGTEATKLMMQFGFNFLNLYVIQLDTIAFNERAFKAYLKAGFKEAGRWRSSVLLNGKRYDEIIMDCLASEFVAPEPGWHTI